MTGNEMLSDVVLYDKYARWMPDQQRRETWPEVTSRVIQFLQTIPEAKPLSGHLWSQLHDAMLTKNVLPSMRVVQMAGPSLDRCHVGAYNCAYTSLESPQRLAELLYILMQGTGVGYSVERRYIDQWPTVAPDWEAAASQTHSIPDTTEGWCDALALALTTALKGQTVAFDDSQIRPEGAWLHTKGGRASGPAPLRRLLDTVTQIIRARAGEKLRPFDVHRMATLCGSIVQVGGVRRAAEICLFDADDTEMLACKNGAFWETYPELTQANNSLVAVGYDEAKIDQLITQLSTTGSGEPGLFRRDGLIPERRTPRDDFGTNPCGEIILRPQQFCNLSIAVARPDDTPASLRDKVVLASIFGTLQSCLTRFRYLGPDWTANSEEERLLGVDITGAQDCAWLQHHGVEAATHLRVLQQVAVATNDAYAALLGIPASKAVTCNKPSGNSSQLLDCASGIHARYAPYYIRRVQLAARSPLSLHLQAKGLTPTPYMADTLDEATIWAFAFPVKAPDGSVTRNDLTAKDQLFIWLMWKTAWTEHNPSCTIYVQPDEWADVAQFLKHYWTRIGGLSFLPKDDNVYANAPYEEISEAQYAALAAQLPPSLDLWQIVETVDLTTVNQDYACVGGLCEL